MDYTVLVIATYAFAAAIVMVWALTKRRLLKDIETARDDIAAEFQTMSEAMEKACKTLQLKINEAKSFSRDASSNGRGVVGSVLGEMGIGGVLQAATGGDVSVIENLVDEVGDIPETWKPVIKGLAHTFLPRLMAKSSDKQAAQQQQNTIHYV